MNLALKAAKEAVGGARIDPKTVNEKRTGIVFASSKPDADTPLQNAGGGDKRTGTNACASALAEAFNLTGPCLSLPAACATGLIQLIRGAQLIVDADADAVLTGAADSSLNPLYLAAYDRMGVLATDACRPFDKRRDGFGVGEGAAAVWLESIESARRRNAPILARLTGWAMGADASGITRVDTTGKALAAVIKRCLRAARLEPDEIDTICAHGTATIPNDLAESRAIERVFGPGTNCPVNSFKGQIGHLLGAAGVVELVMALEGMLLGEILPTVGFEQPDPEIGIHVVHGRSIRRNIRHLLKLSAGFGGHLAAVVLSA